MPSALAAHPPSQRADVAVRAPSGQGEIRTHGTLAGTPVFETGAFNHSATCPEQPGNLAAAQRGVNESCTPSLGEELAQNLPAFRLQHAARDFGPMVESRMSNDVTDRACHPRLR